jgi:hypothetical protein
MLSNSCEIDSRSKHRDGSVSNQLYPSRSRIFLRNILFCTKFKWNPVARKKVIQPRINFYSDDSHIIGIKFSVLIYHLFWIQAKTFTIMRAACFGSSFIQWICCQRITPFASKYRSLLWWEQHNWTQVVTSTCATAT